MIASKAVPVVVIGAGPTGVTAATRPSTPSG